MSALLLLVLAAPVTVRYDDVDAVKVVAEIAAAEKAAIRLDAEYAGKKISLDVEGWKLPEVVEQIAKVVGGKPYTAPSGVYHILPAWKHVLLKRLYESKLGIKALGGMTFGGVFQSLRESTGVPAVLDPKLKNAPDLQLTVDQVTGVQLLDLITAPNEMKWELRYGVVFVARPDRFTELPVRAKFGPLPDKRVKLPFERTPMIQALKYLANAGGVAITGDVDAYEHIEVTLKVPSIEFRHALALTLLPHGLTAKVEGGKIVVKRPVARTPFPAGDAFLELEAGHLDAARKLPKDRLAKVSEDAIERLDEFFNENYKGERGGWTLLYLGMWNALRGDRLGNKEDTDTARAYFTTVLEVVPAQTKEDARIRDAAHRELKRLSK